MEGFTLSILFKVLGPTIIAALTVPAMANLKKVVKLLDKTPPIVQQMAVVGIAGLLTSLGAMLDMAIPVDLHLIDEASMKTIIAAGMAYAMHAGKRAKNERK